MNLIQAVALLSPALFFMGVFCIICFILILFVNRKANSTFLSIFKFVALIVGLIMVLIPAGIIMIIRTENKKEQAQEYYTDTGVVESMKYDKNDRAYFEYDGKTYKELDLTSVCGDVFDYTTYNETKEKDAVFNLKDDLNIIQKLCGYRTEYVAYKLKIGTGDTLYVANDRFFYPEDNEKEIMDYYTSTGWSWKFIVEQGEESVISTELTMSEKDIKSLEAMSNETADKLIDVYNETADDENVYILEKDSKDGIFSGEAEIICHKNKWYWISENTDEGDEDSDDVKCYCQKLPSNISDQINTILKENQ